MEGSCTDCISFVSYRLSVSNLHCFILFFFMFAVFISAPNQVPPLESNDEEKGGANNTGIYFYLNDILLCVTSNKDRATGTPHI